MLKQIDDKVLSKIDPVLMGKLVKLPQIAPPTAAEAIAEIAEDQDLKTRNTLLVGLALHHQDINQLERTENGKTRRCLVQDCNGTIC